VSISSNFNLDLMYGLPGQTHAQALPMSNTALAFPRRTSPATS
jgi:coproporphyrinogen III oxidase-like Fe-S oxidoreductase